MFRALGIGGPQTPAPPPLQPGEARFVKPNTEIELKLSNSTFGSSIRLKVGDAIQFTSGLRPDFSDPDFLHLQKCVIYKFDTGEHGNDTIKISCLKYNDIQKKLMSFDDEDRFDIPTGPINLATLLTIKKISLTNSKLPPVLVSSILDFENPMDPRGIVSGVDTYFMKTYRHRTILVGGNYKLTIPDGTPAGRNITIHIIMISKTPNYTSTVFTYSQLRTGHPLDWSDTIYSITDKDTPFETLVTDRTAELPVYSPPTDAVVPPPAVPISLRADSTKLTEATLDSLPISGTLRVPLNFFNNSDSSPADSITADTFIPQEEWISKSAQEQSTASVDVFVIKRNNTGFQILNMFGIPSFKELVADAIRRNSIVTHPTTREVITLKDVEKWKLQADPTLEDYNGDSELLKHIHLTCKKRTRNNTRAPNARTPNARTSTVAPHIAGLNTFRRLPSRRALAVEEDRVRAPAPLPGRNRQLEPLPSDITQIANPLRRHGGKRRVRTHRSKKKLRGTRKRR